MNIIHQRVNIHFAPKPSFFDPAVELDAGREPNAAHRIQKRILRPLHPPARGLDLPFGQTNAPQFLCLMNIHFAPKTQFFRSRGRTRRRTRTKRGAPDTKTNSPSSAPAGSRPRPPVRPNERPQVFAFCVSWIFKNPVFPIPRSNSTPDANRTRRTGCKNEFPAPDAGRLAVSTSRSARRTPPIFASLKVTHNKGFDGSGPPTSR